MALAVITVASGGLPVVDVTATAPKLGLPVTETTRGIPVTKVTAPKAGLAVVYGTFVEWPPAGGAVTAATLEAGTVTAVTLSGGGLVATNTGTTSTDQGAKVASASGKTSGKYYFEATWTARTGGANEAVGVGTYASTYITMGNTGGVTGVIAYFLGSIWSGGSNLQSLSGWGAGQVMGVAVDLDNRKFWMRAAPAGLWNEQGTWNPATNVGGNTIPAGAMVPFVTFGGTSGLANNVVTLNFGASAFTGAVPSGFTSGWPA